MPSYENVAGSFPSLRDMDFSAAASLANARAMNYIIRRVHDPNSGDRHLGFHVNWATSIPFEIVCPQDGDVPSNFEIERIVVLLGQIGFNFGDICHFFDLKYSYLPHLDGWVMTVRRYCIRHRIDFDITPSSTIRADIEDASSTTSDYSQDVLSDVSEQLSIDPIFNPPSTAPPNLEEQLTRPLAGPPIRGPPSPIDPNSTPREVWSPPPLRRSGPTISPPATRALYRGFSVGPTVQRGLF